MTVLVRSLRTTLIGFSLLCLLSCRAKIDLEGWRQAKWGMTEEEILDAFKGEAVRLNPSERYHQAVATVGIEFLQISGFSFKAHFLLDEKTKRLFQVTIQPLHQEEVNRIPFVLRDAVKDGLTKKYGGASVKDGHTLKWIFPSTIIELDAQEKSLGVDGSVSLVYRGRVMPPGTRSGSDNL